MSNPRGVSAREWVCFADFVAAAPTAIRSDGAASPRQKASLCDIQAHKPTDCYFSAPDLRADTAIHIM